MCSDSYCQGGTHPASALDAAGACRSRAVLCLLNRKIGGYTYPLRRGLPSCPCWPVVAIVLWRTSFAWTRAKPLIPDDHTGYSTYSTSIQYDNRHTQSTVTKEQTSSKPEPIDSSQQTERPELRVPKWEVELAFRAHGGASRRSEQGHALELELTTNGFGLLLQRLPLLHATTPNQGQAAAKSAFYL